MRRRTVLTVAPFLALVFAAAQPVPAKPAPPARDEYTALMDYGPFLSTSVSRPSGKPYKAVDSDSPAASAQYANAKPPAVTGGNAGPGEPAFPIDPIPDGIAQKGIVIAVGGRGSDGVVRATVCFDTDALRMAGGWTGGWLDLTGTMLTNHKGTSHVTLAGTEQFHCDGPGWGVGPRGDDFADPRPRGMGPLSPDRARYKGLYLHGDQVVLSYSIAGADVLELPGYHPPTGMITRTIRVEKSATPLGVAVCTVGDAAPGLLDKNIATFTAADQVTVVMVGAPEGRTLRLEAGTVRLMLPPLPAPTVFRVSIWKGAKADLERFVKALQSAPAHAMADPKPLTAGGPPRWTALTTAGQVGGAAGARRAAPAASDSAYLVDNLALPAKNPWNSWMRLTGLDFFPDGRAAVCTLNGDVWVVSGIDDKLDKLTWRRFATGLYHPMGLRVVDGKVYVRGRDQITRLHDLNDDGEADFYENFNNEGMAHPSYHGFVFDLQTDLEGNFYYARGGLGMATDLPGHGRLTKVSKDGSTVTTLATGLRAPNGLGAGSTGGWVTVSDNQGNWIPSSKIHVIDPSRAPGSPNAPVTPEFLGFLPHHHLARVPSDFTPPLVWIPHKLDNSSGGQAYIASEQWGPYQGQWVHTSFGSSSLMLLLPDGAGPATPATPAKRPPVPRQAAVVRFPLSFGTGIMRPRFNPADGQLYVCGVGGGWQTSGTLDGALYRVRHTGKPSGLPAGFRVVPGGVQLTFPVPLDRELAADAENWAVEQWNYKWTKDYGSPDFSAKTPTKAGHDEVEIKSVTVSEDGKTVTLSIPDLTPVMQMLIQYNLEAADGTPVEHEVYATINSVPGK